MISDSLWWINPKYELHDLDLNIYGRTKVYTRKIDKTWVYAVVQWRAQSAYLIAMYRDGQLLPNVDRVVDDAARRFRIKI